MSISWQSIDIKLPVHEFSKSSTIFMDMDSSTLLISSAKTTCITRLRPELLTATSTDAIENNGETHQLFSNAAFIYKLTNKGVLSKLLCTPCVTMEHGAVFGSSGSSSSDVFTWTEITAKLGNVAAVTGIKNGFSTVVKSCGFYSLNVYKHPDNPSLECSKNLGELQDAEFSIFAFKSSQFSQMFLEHLFSHLHLVLTDVIVVASPSGTVSLVPVLADKSIQESYPIYCDTDQLVQVTVTPCKNAILLIYKNGRIVFIACNDSGISYKKFYLSSTVTAVNILSNGLRFSIIWSDGINVCYTIPKNLIDFSCDQIKTPIRCVVDLVSFGSKILLFNINCCIYVAELINDAVTLEYSEPDTKTAIIEVSKSIDKARDKLKLVENYLEAIKIEQMDASQFKLSVIEDKLLCLENTSSFLFRKDQWRIFIKGSCGQKFCTKSFPLTSDLGSGDKVVLNLEHFIELVSFDLKLYLIGHTYSNLRLLRIPIGSICISSAVNS